MGDGDDGLVGTVFRCDDGDDLGSEAGQNDALHFAAGASEDGACREAHKEGEHIQVRPEAEDEVEADDEGVAEASGSVYFSVR